VTAASEKCEVDVRFKVWKWTLGWRKTTSMCDVCLWRCFCFLFDFQRGTFITNTIN
jgi:hypothetical protein